MTFEETIKHSPFVITEGALVERLRRNTDFQLDPHVVHAAFVYQDQTREAIANLYREYLDIARTYDLPIMLYTATWRANAERLKLADFDDESDVNGENAFFASQIRDEYMDFAEKVFIGGLMGCKGDAYKPEEALSTAEAERFHSYQIKALVHGGVDFLIAQTLPAVSEAEGIARLMGDTHKPYVISFIVRSDGALLDGTPLHEAIARIDDSAWTPPVCYTVNCVHPSVFQSAVAAESKKWPDLNQRLIGLQANTSSKSPDELDNLQYLDTEAPDSFAESMISLHNNFGMRLLGGCCGTDNRHIEGIAKKIKALEE